MHPHKQIKEKVNEKKNIREKMQLESNATS